MERRNKIHSGFTLIELMIVIAIIAVLSMFAYPSYQKSVLKSKRTDAKTALLEIATLQEKTFFQNNLYSQNLTTLYGGTISSDGYYSLALSTATGDTGCDTDGYCYLITATPAVGSSQVADTDCAIFTLNNIGQRLAYDSGTNLTTECW